MAGVDYIVAMIARAREIDGKLAEKLILDMAKYMDSGFAREFQKKFTDGQCFGLVPEGTSEAQLLNFKSGGLTIPGKEFFEKGKRIVQVNTLNHEFASVLAGLTAHDPTVMIVGFDVMGDKSKSINGDDLNLRKAPFGILETKSLTLDGILDFMNSFASAWTTILMAVRDPGSVKRAVDLANAVVLYAVGAYDGESYIYWKSS